MLKHTSNIPILAKNIKGIGIRDRFLGMYMSFLNCLLTYLIRQFSQALETHTSHPSLTHKIVPYLTYCTYSISLFPTSEVQVQVQNLCIVHTTLYLAVFTYAISISPLATDTPRWSPHSLDSIVEEMPSPNIYFKLLIELS